MSILHIWFKNPKTYERVINVEIDEHRRRKSTLVIEDELIDKSLKIPITPYIHPLGIRELAALSCKHGNSASNVAMALVSCLKSREQKNTIKISYIELSTATGLSTRSISTNINFLIANKYIIKKEKQAYYISPRLAWFGNQVDWAIALKEEQNLTGN